MSELRWLRVLHETVYDYEPAVELAHHLACLSPRETAWQQVRDWQLTITPAPDGEADLQSRLSLDPWGNARLVFSHARVHERLLVRSQFEAGIRAAPAPDCAASPPWEQVAEALRYRAGAVRTEAVEFTLASPLAPRDAALAEFGRQAFEPGLPLASGALALMRQIHAQFKYAPLATDVGTRAPQALALKRGVCQDFAHVMIAACRSLGLAARYVSGYLLTRPAPGKPRLVGADASHAWVEVWCPRLGWLALDPTNNVQAGQDHVTLAWGRDYADVAPLRGVIRGGGSAEPRVAVTVEPMDEAKA
ncbi:transglutaminase family protein [Roseateles violae]|uniref:Transglutaminase family protein n=1 Tax=Roseateles violae TaxID=3058042 RepID=A0ABT8DYC3_9BURK|nr:transglutaminase family protein [Pelomonas sp. PFR6]MDN3922276.1 transglutaminase family protein [Pelomonas sp. PFR6]